MLLTVDEARAYARDFDSSDEEITALIDVAEDLIAGSCGDGFDRASPKARMLAKLYVADLNDDRAVSSAGAKSRRDLVSSLILQLRTQTDKGSGVEEG